MNSNGSSVVIDNSGNGPFGPVVNGTQIIFFEYRPNEAAGYAFTVLFGLLTLGHLIFMFWKRAWFFIPFFLGGICETFGYYGRVQASSRPSSAGPFILQNLLILVATPFLAATVYMSLGRIITALEAQQYSLINIRWMTKIYILIDFGCIISQFIGSIIPASGDADAIKKARVILLGGLGTQIAALSLFIFTCSYVHARLKKDPPRLVFKGVVLNWGRHFWAIEGITFLMIVRGLVRTIEFLQGTGGFVAIHEMFIYACDAAPMVVVMLVFLVFYPGRLVRDARRLRDESEGGFLLETRQK